MQLLSSAAYSIGHGANDAQKTMGIITVLLFSTGYLHGEFHVPLWVVLAAQAAMGLGTLMGGWRIVHTMGSKITRLTPHQGFCAETGGALLLFGATAFGIPVSTTHTITGCDHGRRRRAASVRSTLGRSGQHRGCLDPDHSGRSTDRRTCVRRLNGHRMSRRASYATEPSQQLARALSPLNRASLK